MPANLPSTPMHICHSDGNKTSCLQCSLAKGNGQQQLNTPSLAVYPSRSHAGGLLHRQSQPLRLFGGKSSYGTSIICCQGLLDSWEVGSARGDGDEARFPNKKDTCILPAVCEVEASMNLSAAACSPLLRALQTYSWLPTETELPWTLPEMP